MSVYSLHIAVYMYMHTVDKAHISQAVPANVGCDVCEAKALADPVSNACNKLGLCGSIHIWVVMLVVASDDLLDGWAQERILPVVVELHIGLGVTASGGSAMASMPVQALVYQ